MSRKLAVKLALVGALAAFSSPALAKGPQITVSVNLSPRPAATGATGASAVPTAAPPVNPALLQGQVAWAEAGAYTRYLQYVTLVNSPAGRGMSPQDAAQYFTNGASMMTVPPAGQPGSAYFNNGSELGAPPPAPTALPASALAPALPPPPPAPPATRPSPWWWGDDTTDSTDPPAPTKESAPAQAQGGAAPVGAAATPAPPPAAADEGPTPVAALSFEEWLEAMGGPTPDDDTEGDAVDAPEPAPAPSDVPSVQEASIFEPLSAAIEIIPRTVFAPREKHERAALPASAPSLLGEQTVAVAFGAGLLLGALAMMRLRRREEPLAVTPDPAPAPAPRSQAL